MKQNTSVGLNRHLRMVLQRVWGAQGYELLQQRWYKLNRRLPWTALGYRRTRRFAAKFGMSVRRGPFTGLRYPETSVGRVFSLVPRILGSYEAELHQQLEQLIGERPATIINVGAADGYYAIGMALRCPDTRIFAFDVDSAARQWCAEGVRLNGVEGRVEIAGECRLDWLQKLSPSARTLIIMDCEGCEEDLLLPDACPALASATVLVEIHERKRAGVKASLIQRFSGSHAITLVPSEARDYRSYPELEGFSPGDASRMVWERPYQMEWAIMRPRPGQ